jgi:hypothetical protein
MAEQRIANKRLDQGGGAFIDRRLAFNKNNLPILDQGWNNYVLTVDEFGITSLTDANLTSSFAISASYAESSSYAVTASFAQNFNPLATASYALQALSASYASTASTAVSASYALSASFATSASRAISASFATSASYALSASFAISSSRAVSASFADSASQAISASFAVSASRAISASFAISASYAFQATSASFSISSSYALSASFASTASRAISASYVSGTIAAPGLTTQVIYNSGSVLGADSGFVYSGGSVAVGTTPLARLHIRGAGATSATTTFLLQNSTPASLMQVLDNGQFTYSGPLLSLASTQSAFVISQSISQSATVGGQVYGVNITPTFFATTASQTETAFRVNATFTGSAAAVSGSNIIADFGAVSAGSQLTVTDVTSGSIYMVNDVSGLPIIEATSDWTVNMYNYPNIIFQKTGSVINISGSLRVSGSSVFTGSINVLGAVTATSFTGSLFGTASWANNAISASYAATASVFLGTLNRITTGSVTASVNVANDIFLIQSGSFTPFSISSTGATTISSSAQDIFLIRNSNNTIVFEVSQSGVITLSTQSVVLSDPAPVGGIYFTSASMYLGLE